MKYVLSLFVIVLFAVGCESTEPINKGKLYITTEDVSCTEAWIKVTVNDVALPAELQLFRNDSVAQIINLSRSDTVIYEDSLAPSTEYNYTAKLAGISSSIAAVRTMDTTSHDYTWETYRFGGGSSSSLNDVAIIDENNIWAVGEIHTPETDQFDSNGVWVQPYNAVHWDGDQWELKRIYFYTFCEQEHKAPYEIRAIFSFDNGVVLMSSGSQITYMQNKQQGTIECIPASVNAIWGTSSSDFYVVGNGGNIAHFNGSSWEKIESGTTTTIQDIYGFVGKTNNVKKIYCAVGEVFQLSEMQLLEIANNEIINRIDMPEDKRIHSVYIANEYKTFTAGGGIYIKSNDIWTRQNEVPGYYTEKIRGANINEVMCVGDYGIVAHYNGITWCNYPELKIAGIYNSLAIKKNNIAVIVGFEGSSGIIQKLMKRN